MNVKRVSPEEALSLVEQEGYRYVDVRSVPEFEAGHPTGAYNVPIAHLGSMGMSPNPEFLAVMEKAFPKDSKLVIGCKSGGRSLQASGMLLAAGFQNVLDQRAGFQGGMDRQGVRAGLGTEGPAVEQRGAGPLLGRLRGRKWAPRGVVAERAPSAGPSWRPCSRAGRGAVPTRSPRDGTSYAAPSGRTRRSSAQGRPRRRGRLARSWTSGRSSGARRRAIASGAWSGGTTLEAPRRRMGPHDEDQPGAVTRSAGRPAHLLKQGGSVVTVGSKAAETGGAGAAPTRSRRPRCTRSPGPRSRESRTGRALQLRHL